MKSYAKYVLLIVLALSTAPTIGQQFFQFGIKEHHDDLYNGLLLLSAHQIDQITAGENGTHKRFGETMGGELESYIIMYEQTKDKAYLYKFINRAITIQNTRGDIGAFGGFGWSTLFYKNGLVLYPQAHFVHLVKVDEPGLADAPLFDDLLTNHTTSFTKIGQFADWLNDRVQESLDYYIDNDFWMGSSLGFREAPDKLAPVVMNMQSAFGAALFYIGHAYTIPDYLLKAVNLAALYKSQANKTDQCHGLGDLTYNHPVLRIKPNNSYWWYHSGWSFGIHPPCPFPLPPFVKVNQPRVEDFTFFHEDISHGGQDLIFPEVAYKYGLSSGNTVLFTEVEMTRYRNTFAKNIYNNGGFHNAVFGNGADNEIFNNTCGPEVNNNPMCPFDFHRAVVPTWAFLYRFDDFDNTPKPLYDIMLEYYDSDLLLPNDDPKNAASGLFIGAKYAGLADIMTAQWDKECMSMTLKNRRVVYNQNFFAENILTVDPAAENAVNLLNANSYADPIIVDDKFIIEPNVEVDMTAGTEVHLKPGFHAREGSEFHAFIDQSLNCGNGKWAGSSGSGTGSNRQEITAPAKKKKTEPMEEPKEQPRLFRIYPNPTTGVFTVAGATDEIQVLDLFGRVVLTTLEPQIDMSTYPSGIYFVKVGEVVRKLVKE